MDLSGSFTNHDAVHAASNAPLDAPDAFVPPNFSPVALESAEIAPVTYNPSRVSVVPAVTQSLGADPPRRIFKPFLRSQKRDSPGSSGNIVPFTSQSSCSSDFQSNASADNIAMLISTDSPTPLGTHANETKRGYDRVVENKSNESRCVIFAPRGFLLTIILSFQTSRFHQETEEATQAAR